MSHVSRLALAPLAVVLAGAACEDAEPPDIVGVDAAAPVDSGPVDGLPVPDARVQPDGASLDGGPVSDWFTVVVLPDTQFYAAFYPHMFEAQARFVVTEKAARQIAFVLHEGDIVETPSSNTEWSIAKGSLSLLDGVVPYFLAAGNHDILGTREAPLFNATFPPSLFAPHLRGSHEPGKLQNAWYVVPAGGREWLVLSLEFGPRDEVVTWADGVLKSNAQLPAILITHAYMHLDDRRYDEVRWPKPMQYYNPHHYGLPGTTNDGQQMYDKLVAGNDNLFLVLSGHVPREGGATGRISSRRPNGKYVHELLVNYQGCPSESEMCVHPTTGKRQFGGEGYLRLMRFELAQKRILVETWSPHVMQAKVDATNQFELPIEL